MSLIHKNWDFEEKKLNSFYETYMYVSVYRSGNWNMMEILIVKFSYIF